MRKRMLKVLGAGAVLSLGLLSAAFASERISVNPADGKELGHRIYPVTVMVVGSYDANGKADIALIDRGGVVSSHPRLIGIGVSKKRATHDNIVASGAFTVNIPSQAFMAETDFVGNHSLKKFPDMDKFAETGLTARKAETVNAPLVEEFPVSLECEVSQALDFESHTFFIGLVKKVWVAKEVLNEKGKPIAEQMRPLLYYPGEGHFYSLTEPVGKPGEEWSKKFPPKN